MEKVIDLFAKWKLEQPTQRRALYVHSCHLLQYESVLYMICSWDYVYRPSDTKSKGLTDLFIRTGSAGEVNVSSGHRKAALKLIDKPAAPTVMNEGTNWKRAVKLLRRGGVKSGGAGNYNLTTKAIEQTLPECMNQVDDIRLGSKRLSVVVQQGVGNLRPTKQAQDLVRQIAQSWGAGIIELGLG